MPRRFHHPAADPRRDAGPEYLTGQLLISMPGMGDPRFQHAVIYMCAHNADGAMGLVVNKLFGSITFADLLEQLGLDPPSAGAKTPVHYGGPVESGRGFVLHSTDYVREGTLVVDDEVALSATLDILKAMGENRGPRHAILLLGYTGWGPGQLDAEIQANGWLNAPCDDGLLFDADLAHKWQRSFNKLGVDPLMLSAEAGHA